MEWLTPTHLNVTYGKGIQFGEQIHLDFQAVRCADIQISLRDLSSGMLRNTK